VGITMIYVTHDQTEAMSMSDRIAVFSQGKIEQIGAPLDVYHRPQTKFVGEFVGDSNFFHGRRQGDKLDGIFLEGLGVMSVPPDKLREVHPGRSVDVMVRPERLRLVNGSSADPVNVIDMKIDTIVNYGDSLMVVGTSNHLPIRMRLSGELPAVAEGATIRVGWAAEDAHLIPQS
jgi:putative spermidine/putrescine transport system ATP-binding protein